MTRKVLKFYLLCCTNSMLSLLYVLIAADRADFSTISNCVKFPMHGSPFQIYYFALPFSPPSSWLQRYYSMELSNAVKIVTGAPPGWGKCSRTVSPGGSPLYISCWDNNVAVCLHSGDIMILDAVTGSQIAVFLGTHIGLGVPPSHQMGYCLYLEVMIKLSNSGMCRLVGLLRHFVATNPL